MEESARKNPPFGLLRVVLFIAGDLLLDYIFPRKEEFLTRNLVLIAWGVVVFLGIPRLRRRRVTG